MQVVLKESFYSNRLLSYVLPGYLKLVNDHTSAVTVKHLSSRDMEDVPLPLPPRNEQDRLVSKIDELFSSIDEGERALERVRKLVERYRQSVLKAAVTGELTREWRAQHAGELESGEALLTRILEARRQAWEQSELAKIKAKGRVHSNDDWKRNLTYPCMPDVSLLPALPMGWRWLTLDQLAYEGPTNGYSPKSEPTSTGSLALKLTATTSGHLRLDANAVKRIGETVDPNSDLWLKTGDLLIQRGNTIDYVGVAAIFKEDDHRYIYPDLMMRVRIAGDLERVWAWRVINSEFTRRYFRERATGTAGSMPKVSGEVVRNVPIPMPSRKELTEVLSLLEQALVYAEKLIGETACRLTSATALRQSILKAAFSGQLLPQDPTDEPASVLLERIAAERIAAERAAAPKPTARKQAVAKKRRGKAKL